MSMTISVIVPTYNRVDALENCLDGLRRQTRYPDEIVMVVRKTDSSTMGYLPHLVMVNLKVVYIEQTGVIAALNLGIQQSTGSIVVMTDDDTIPHPNWLNKIEEHYLKQSDIGGIGGRDIVHIGGSPVSPATYQVGIIKPYGRIIGNHHIGIGGTREVDVLKGANMSFRRAAMDGLWFDENLKGTGAQVHNEMEFSLAVKRRGWKLVYDSEVCVDHYPAQRFDEDKRNSFNETAFYNTAHNETYSILKHSSLLNRVLYVLWVILVGSKSSPGFVQCARMLPKHKHVAFKKIMLAYKGRWGGWKTWRESLE